MAAAVAAASLHPDQDTDPRELEAFAERFKQRRIKLGKYLKKTYSISYQENFEFVELSQKISIRHFLFNSIKQHLKLVFKKIIQTPPRRYLVPCLAS